MDQRLDIIGTSLKVKFAPFLFPLVQSLAQTCDAIRTGVFSDRLRSSSGASVGNQETGLSALQHQHFKFPYAPQRTKGRFVPSTRQVISTTAGWLLKKPKHCDEDTARHGALVLAGRVNVPVCGRGGRRAGMCARTREKWI